MRVGLAAYRFVNGDMAFSLTQMERAMEESRGKVDLLCFGETFLQGFDALCWTYERDRDIAITQDSLTMKRLCEMTLRYGIDLLFGYIEREGEALYSSCAVIENGQLTHNYRRISKNWKMYDRTDDHYREGEDTTPLRYKGRTIALPLCGDMWIYPERFHSDDLMIWPVYVNFSLEEWPKYQLEYAEQARLGAPTTLLVNSITADSPSHGGAFLFRNGSVERMLDLDREGILIVDV